MPFPQQTHNYYSISTLGLQFLLGHLGSHAATEIYISLMTQYFTPHDRHPSARFPIYLTIDSPSVRRP